MTNNIAKQINESCKDDMIMRNFLIELLNLGLTGRQWYKDSYRKLISDYTKKKDESNAD